MKTKVVLHTVGQILLIEAGLLIIPVFVGLIYHEQASVSAFLITAVITAAAGGLLRLVNPGKSSIYAREGLAITGISGYNQQTIFPCFDGRKQFGVQFCLGISFLVKDVISFPTSSRSSIPSFALTV